MKKRVSIFLSLLLVVFLVMGLTGCGTETNTDSDSGEETPKSSGQVFINIGTGGTAGTYFPLGGAFAEIWNNDISGINATATSTGASVANVNLLKEGEVEVVIIQNDIASYAETGTVLFEGEPYPNIRGLCTLYSEPLQLVTTDKSIKTVADLKGKRVAVGAIGSGVEANARQIIAAAGLDFENDINPKFLSFAEASTGLKDKQLDAAFLVAGVPTAAIVDLSTQNDVFVVPIDGKVAENLMSTYPFYTEFIIPAATYKGQTEDVKSLSVRAMLAVNDNLDEELAYNMVKSIYENSDRITAAHNVGKDITKDTALDGIGITLHPGAQRYFDEQ
ncbi:TAXI family TRAP transporter solute-binding subunit [Sedimentibacter hydroxybenzoicus DSM 7310]|uniref:TAXI family TRAP transporter solute-binding subunit n=1 Tax=Sedimentibacter hydroxybenzoicus DSM 7310 TaxID=1123245 RepID=A0A974BI07_SEDHY|nr:TAXI family TRAP transporter solute-binding subunit [Sedimentibacter hydroxybenzoicus]NYB73468.1 TAXI family TRAP transporter solute-binding subunit [Sedimentibacter hydroxybenzoicus DSM 7310]